MAGPVRRRTLAPLALPLAAPARAEAFPSRPVSIVVPYAPGGSSDLMGRGIARALGEMWRSPVVVENRPGGTTTVGTAHVAQSPGDGHTLLVAPPPFVISPHVFPVLPYQPLRDFRGVALVAFFPLVVVVPASSPARDLAGLVALARAQGGLAYPSPGSGTTPHLVMAQLSRDAGVPMTHVPYRSGGQGVVDLIAGRLGAYAGPTVEVVPHVLAGRLRAITTLAARRAPLLPEVPTAAEAGFPNLVATSWTTLAAPAATPAALRARIAADLAQVARQPDFRDPLVGQGAEVVGLGPEEAEALWREEDARWGPLVRAIGVRPES